MKNLIITLPKQLWWAIEHGHKMYECRKTLPKLAQKGSKVYVVEKGTTYVRGYFYIDSIVSTNNYYQAWKDYGRKLYIKEEWFNDYTRNHYGFIHFWKIAGVCKFESDIDLNLYFGITHNPQSFVYTDLDPYIPRRIVQILDPEKNKMVTSSYSIYYDIPYDLPL